jgi:hypothetical protein
MHRGALIADHAPGQPPCEKYTPTIFRFWEAISLLEALFRTQLPVTIRGMKIVTNTNL